MSEPIICPNCDRPAGELRECVSCGQEFCLACAHHGDRCPMCGGESEPAELVALGLKESEVREYLSQFPGSGT